MFGGEGQEEGDGRAREGSCRGGRNEGGKLEGTNGRERPEGGKWIEETTEC